MNEKHCQDCYWWKNRNGNACVNRTLSYLFSGINESAKEAYDMSFTEDCYWRKI